LVRKRAKQKKKRSTRRKKIQKRPKLSPAAIRFLKYLVESGGISDWKLDRKYHNAPYTPGGTIASLIKKGYVKAYWEPTTWYGGMPTGGMSTIYEITPEGRKALRRGW